MLGYAFYQSIDGVYVNIPLKFETTVVTTDKKVYKKGDSIAIRWKYYKGVDTISTISVNLVDGVVWFLPNTYSTRLKGYYDSYTVVAKIPDAISSGTYHLDSNINFRVNAFKDINYKITSLDFIIEDGELQKQVDENTENIEKNTEAIELINE